LRSQGLGDRGHAGRGEAVPVRGHAGRPWAWDVAGMASTFLRRSVIDLEPPFFFSFTKKKWWRSPSVVTHPMLRDKRCTNFPVKGHGHGAFSVDDN
jgi:hypothetical protein